jgi:DnaJ-class molecular chaperone
MTSEQVDYYEVLGVPRDATTGDIKRAFRQLAMKYHPDRNSDPEAESQFKTINDAQEVLADPQRRLMYDRLGPLAWDQPPYYDDLSDLSCG